MKNMMSAQEFDVVIAGAGLVGALAAIAWTVSQPQLRVALVDPAEAVPQQDHRSIALALRSQEYLEQLGVWKFMSSQSSIQNIHVSDTEGIGSAWLRARDEKVKSLGFVAQAGDIQQALMKRLEEITPSSALHIFYNNQVVQRTQYKDYNHLLLAQGQSIQAKLFVAADGSQSPTRKLLGIQTKDKDYQQRALVGFLETDRAVQSTAYERFTPHGPFALLPADSSRTQAHRTFAFIWCVDQAEAQRYLALSEMDFRASAQQLFGRRAGYFTRSERYGSFPLYLKMAERLIGHRTLLLGNAAHTLHPVAGQGYNLGLRDVQTFQTLLEQQRNPQDPGQASILDLYVQARTRDYRQLQGMTDSFVSIFSNSNPLIGKVRRAALCSLGIYPKLAQPITQLAMGFATYRQPKE